MAISNYTFFSTTLIIMGLTKKQITYLLIAIIGIIAVLLINLKISHSLSGTDRGTFGDVFGFANAIFGAFGTLALLITIWLQFNEIKNTARVQQEQMFDSSFFSLMNIHRENINALSYSDKTGSVLLSFHIENALRNVAYKADILNKEKQADLFFEYLSKLHAVYNSYIDSFYNLAYFITSSSINGINKIKYFDILSSSTSLHEKYLIYFYLIRCSNIQKWSVQSKILERTGVTEQIQENWFRDYKDDIYI